MIDYNKKFKELNNKITRITEETRNNNKAINQYYSKLEQIESKINSKLSFLDKSLTSLKDYYTRLSSQYEKYYKSSKKNIIENPINDILKLIKDKCDNITVIEIGKDLSFDLKIHVKKDKQGLLFAQILNMKSSNELISEININMEPLENILIQP